MVLVLLGIDISERNTGKVTCDFHNHQGKNSVFGARYARAKDVIRHGVIAALVSLFAHREEGHLYQDGDTKSGV